MSQDQDLIDKYLSDTPEMRDLLCYPDRDKLRSILTRFLAEVRRGVDVESVWEELRLDETVEFPNWDGSGEPHFLMISKQQLAAALASVQKGSGE